MRSHCSALFTNSNRNMIDFHSWRSTVPCMHLMSAYQAERKGFVWLRRFRIIFLSSLLLFKHVIAGNCFENDLRFDCFDNIALLRFGRRWKSVSRLHLQIYSKLFFKYKYSVGMQRKKRKEFHNQLWLGFYCVN